MSDTYLIDEQEISNVLKLSNARVVKNTTIQTPETLGQNSLFHIALAKRTRLYPSVSSRSAPTEDNTLPRIHVSPDLIGCIRGYATIAKMASQNAPVKIKKETTISSPGPSIYKGGFYIHQIPFRCCLKPNYELVFDEDYTQEYWLITYNSQTLYYPTVIIGQMFPNFVTYYPQTGSIPSEVTNFCLRIDKGSTISLSNITRYDYIKGKELEKKLLSGFYSFDFTEIAKGNKTLIHGISNVKEIDEKTYTENKLRAAAMLNFE